MASNKYILGQAPNCYCEFRVNNTLTDPTTISLLIHDPDGIDVTYTYAAGEITKENTGKFSKNINAQKLGTWFWKWTGTGTCIAATEGYFTIVTHIG